jgi:SAM-dependent methyltransferase
VDPVIDVRLGAFPEILADVSPETAALVVADPPWNDLDAWSAIGLFSARVLKPNGILLAYIGNRWAFEAMDLLSANLNRVRLAFLPVPHESPWDPAVNSHEAGSFMVIMSKGSFDPPGSWCNKVDGVVQGQRWHPFQRPLANVKHYVEAFSMPGDLVVDPFFGSGTTAVACAQLSRSFVGCDIVPENFNVAVARLELLRDGKSDVEAPVDDSSTMSEPPEIEPTVTAMFATGAEQVRLAKNPLEFERNKALLIERLPPNGRVLDIGGGPGAYASLLAAQGYLVDLVDPVPLHVEQAREAARSGAYFDAHLGDARKLEFPDGVADAVLLMGPLYYLVDAGDRARSLSEAFRVLRPGGVLAVAALGRIFPLRPVAIRNIWHEGAADGIMSTIRTGVMPISGGINLYTHRPEELRSEIAAAGFEETDVLAVTGLFELSGIFENLPDTRSRDSLLAFLHEVEGDPAMVGISEKLMGIARRPEERADDTTEA